MLACYAQSPFAWHKKESYQGFPGTSRMTCIDGMAYSVQLLRLQPRRRAEQKKYTRQAAQINTQIQAVNNLRCDLDQSKANFDCQAANQPNRNSPCLVWRTLVYATHKNTGHCCSQGQHAQAPIMCCWLLLSIAMQLDWPLLGVTGAVSMHV